MDVVGRLRDLTRARCVDPGRLTMVTSSTICEFMGFTREQWHWFMNPACRSPMGPPPPPREAGKRTRGPGVSDLWLMELDIVPWLLRSEEGSGRLLQVVGELVELAGAPV